MFERIAESTDRIDAKTSKTVAKAIGERLRTDARPEDSSCRPDSSSCWNNFVRGMTPRKALYAQNAFQC